MKKQRTLIRRLMKKQRTLICRLMKKQRRLVCRLTLLLLAAALPFGCARPKSDERGQQQPEILVAASANLTEAFAELGRLFTERTGVRVNLSFGATAELAKQIEQGAPFDLFASADAAHVEQLERQALLTEGTRALYARGRLVLWLPRESRAIGVVRRLEDLTDPRVARIALAKPDVAPYGRAAVEALGSLKLWESIEPKVVYAQNVSQVRQFAASGNAEAAFLPRSLVRMGEGVSFEVEAQLHRPIEQELAVVRASGRQAEARRFAEFVLGEEGQALLEKYGYERARSDAKATVEQQ